jgi:hypothetical protein
MQGVVCGTQIDAMGDDERIAPCFDFDQCFGTAIDRRCAEAVTGQPLEISSNSVRELGPYEALLLDIRPDRTRKSVAYITRTTEQKS